ncbi:MAG: AMP-dependent synthetase and ligase [Myxococcaceae bacterium]|nr:AMP-dependent synthetase and ligase [Myxococcaceae bacterium]
MVRERRAQGPELTVYSPRYSCDWLARREMLTPDRPALIEATGARRTLTWRELNRSTNRTANWLQTTLGVRRGDRVAIVAKNSVFYLELWFACGKLGAVLQTLNWRLTPSELGALLAAAPPKVLVHGASEADAVAAIRKDLRVTEHVLLVDEAAQARDGSTDAPPPAVDLGPEDPWVICYTGGSTGVPKGAVLTHGSVMANAVNTVTSWGLTQDDVAILNAPLFHVGGLNVLTTPLVLVGGTSIVCEAFDAGQVLDLVSHAGVTAFFGVPTMFLALLEHPSWKTADFTRVKLVISGGAPCPAPIFEAFWARGIDFKTGYGLTEAGPNNFWLPPALVREKAGSVGFPLMLVEAKIVDESGAECAADVAGELLLRGPHLFAGYDQRPDETARALEGGWLHTGDLARRDADGCHFIVGRSKDLIISGGENVYPAEVEGILAQHPDVAEATLVGVPDPKWGEVGRAIVVARAGSNLDADTLLAFARERLARYKVPKDVRFVDALPRTAAGKIDKPLLRRTHGEA